MEVKSCFGMFWAKTKQTPDDLQQLFTPTASLKGKIQKILSIMRQWVEKWSIASTSPSIPSPSPSLLPPHRPTLFRIFKLPVFVLAVALGSHFSPVWKLILVSCHSQHFSGTSAKYIFTKNSVWFGEISLAHAASQALFGASIWVMSIMLFWENGERQAIDAFEIGPHVWESVQSWPGPVHLRLFTYLFPLPHSLPISICDYQ